MQLISKAPDATVFLSTAALIVGVFLAAAAAALVGYLPKTLVELMLPVKSSSSDDRYISLIRGLLFTLLMINAVGTTLLFALLFADTLTSMQPVWVWIGFFYTIFVIIANLGAVSMMYLGPISARRRRRSVAAAPKIAQAKTPDAGAVSRETIAQTVSGSVSDQMMRNFHGRASASLVFGFAAGIMTGAFIKRSGWRTRRVPPPRRPHGLPSCGLEPHGRDIRWLDGLPWPPYDHSDPLHPLARRQGRWPFRSIRAVAK
jgi:hypothetical protein